MGDDIGSGLMSMAICFDFRSTNVVQLSNRNPYFYRFRCCHPLITQLRLTLSLVSLLETFYLQPAYGIWPWGPVHFLFFTLLENLKYVCIHTMQWRKWEKSKYLNFCTNSPWNAFIHLGPWEGVKIREGRGVSSIMMGIVCPPNWNRLSKARNMCKIFYLVPSKKPVTRENWDILTKCLLFNFWVIKFTDV